jgi:hypothetical protein
MLATLLDHKPCGPVGALERWSWMLSRQPFGNPPRSARHARREWVALSRLPQFGVTVESETTFCGITIPKQVRAGWWWHTDRQADGEFFRATVTEAAFR